MAAPSTGARVRLAELVAALSLGIDLGFGQPMEHVLRQCLIALRLAERLGLDEASARVVYYIALLVWVGCHVDALRAGEVVRRRHRAEGATSDQVDLGSRGSEPRFMLRHLGAGRPAAAPRSRSALEFVG